MLWLTSIDSSGQEALENLLERFKNYGIDTYLCSVRPKILHNFMNTGFIKKI